MEEDVPQFGTPEPGRTYVPRPSAYALATFEHRRILCVRVGIRLHLPGGGLKPGEDPAEGVLREVYEETGYRGDVIAPIGRANQYVIGRSRQIAVNKLGHFFRVRLSLQGTPRSQNDHVPVVLSLDDAARMLLHEFQRWAVKRLREGGVE